MSFEHLQKSVWSTTETSLNDRQDISKIVNQKKIISNNSCSIGNVTQYQFEDESNRK